MSLDKIAMAGVEIHTFHAEDFIAALDDSGDLCGLTMDKFDDMLLSKWMEMDELLISDLDAMGIESPLLVDVENDGSWTMVDGHHRLAWAAVRNAEVPVVFVTMEMDPIKLWETMDRFVSFYDHA